MSYRGRYLRYAAGPEPELDPTRGYAPTPPVVCDECGRDPSDVLCDCGRCGPGVVEFASGDAEEVA